MAILLKSNKIKNISALEILDSRGFPTISVRVELDSGVVATASVPAGTSSGVHEAFELRDGDHKRYQGRGMLKAVASVEQKIAPKLLGLDVSDQKKIDETMIELDGTANKSQLGANAIVGVSIASARAAAYATKTPLFKYLRTTLNLQATDLLATSYNLPQPQFNMLNGGRHADSGMDVQEFMFVPYGSSFSESLRFAAETFESLRKKLKDERFETSVGYEGGYAPKLGNSEQAIEILISAGKDSGLSKKQFGIALDVAASELVADEAPNEYMFERERIRFGTNSLIEWYASLVKKFSIISIEDGLNQEDWSGWRKLTYELGSKILIVGDDLTVTSPSRLERAIGEKAVNSVIIKPNQIGTLTELAKTVTIAREHNIKMVVSHRSGDTNDPFIADLSVAIGAEYIKSGSVCRGERVAKYNRLLEIEKKLEQE